MIFLRLISFSTICFIFSQIVKAETVSFSSSLNFFEKKSFDSIQTEPLCRTNQFSIQIDLPENSFQIQKIYSQNLTCGELSAILEIYYHQREDARYFSQQIYVNFQQKTIALCTSYFSIEQNYLVPGACAGLNPIGLVLGLSIFRK